jgi:fatty acid desaturase
VIEKPLSTHEAAASTQWPTLMIAGLIYSGWALASYFHDRLPWPILAAVGGWLVAWHNSLQHEVIHGHPTPWRRMNTLIALPPLCLWLPLEAYRQSHLAHHATEHLTDPDHDPESRYPRVGPGFGARLARIAGQLQANLIGRLTLGPIFDVIRFMAGEGDRIVRGDWTRLRMWALHAVTVSLVLAWLHFVCRMSLVQYLACFVYPGAALSLVRSFAEHRADPDPARRVAVVERAPVFGLLFLNNNLHAAHHDQPGAPWHILPRLYARERERLLTANGGLVYDGYAQVFRRYLWRPHDASSPPDRLERHRA